jgi:RNA polymerase sigma-70 factor (ECF subfamily)
MSPYADDTLVSGLSPEGLPPASLDDKELTLAFQRGDKDAYDTIHQRYEERVHRVCRRMLGKPEDAQEAAQETFIRVYTALGKFNGRYHLGAWITRIATNVCLDHIRARSRRPVEATPVEELDVDLLASGADDPEEVTVRNAESRRVRKVLLGLPPMHRAAIVLRDFEGLSYAEVGVVLGMSECQVKALIHRARKGFRRSWTPLVEMLVPARLLQRFRDVDVAVKEQATHAVASQSAPVVSVCSGLLQQCGSFVVERVAPGIATVILGGATALASPLTGGGPAPSPEPSRAPSIADVVLGGADRAAAPEDEAKGIGATTAPAPTTAPPVPAPSATPSESPSPTAPPSQAPETASPPPASGTAAPRPTPTPAPFQPVFYYEYGQTPTPRTPVVNDVQVNCARLTVNQLVTAEISDHEGAYPITADLETSGSRFEIAFTVRKKGFDVNYSGGGALISQSNTGNGLQLTFNGRYGTGGTAADSAGLPMNGSVRIELGLDCTAQSLVAESVVLTTQ